MQTASVVESGLSHGLDQTDRADHLEFHGAAADKILPVSATALRTALLDAVRSAVNAVLLLSVEAGGSALRCEMPAVRNLCVAIEASMVFQLLPPLFSLSSPGVWQVLWHLQTVRRRGASSRHVGDDVIHIPVDAIALARDLCDKHLSLAAPNASTAIADAYTARLWVCLGLQRRSLTEWIDVIAVMVPQAYADGAILNTTDDRSVLLDLLSPLRHLSFILPPTAPPLRWLPHFLGLEEANGTDGGTPRASEFFPSHPPPTMGGSGEEPSRKPARGAPPTGSPSISAAADHPSTAHRPSSAETAHSFSMPEAPRESSANQVQAGRQAELIAELPSVELQPTLAALIAVPPPPAQPALDGSVDGKGAPVGVKGTGGPVAVNGEEGEGVPIDDTCDARGELMREKAGPESIGSGDAAVDALSATAALPASTSVADRDGVGGPASTAALPSDSHRVAQPAFPREDRTDGTAGVRAHRPHRSHRGHRRTPVTAQILEMGSDERRAPVTAQILEIGPDEQSSTTAVAAATAAMDEVDDMDEAAAVASLLVAQLPAAPWTLQLSGAPSSSVPVNGAPVSIAEADMACGAAVKPPAVASLADSLASSAPSLHLEVTHSAHRDVADAAALVATEAGSDMPSDAAALVATEAASDMPADAAALVTLDEPAEVGASADARRMDAAVADASSAVPVAAKGAATGEWAEGEVAHEEGSDRTLVANTDATAEAATTGAAAADAPVEVTDKEIGAGAGDSALAAEACAVGDAATAPSASPVVPAETQGVESSATAAADLSDELPSSSRRSPGDTMLAADLSDESPLAALKLAAISGRYDAREAARLRAAACASGSTWAALLAQVDGELLDGADASAVGLLFADIAAVDRMPLYSDGDGAGDGGGLSLVGAATRRRCCDTSRSGAACR